jgi:hypothetical protein
MSRTVAALFSTRAEAETAQARLKAQLQTTAATIIGQHDGESLTAFRFSDDDRTFYQQALSRGDYLVCATVQSGEDPERVVQVLQSSASTTPVNKQASTTEQERSTSTSQHAATGESAARTLFVGDAWIARGDAHVTYTGTQTSYPALSRSIYNPPGTARLSDEEVQAAGLLQNRTIEASAMDEVPVITRRPVVREEVVIRKAAEERTKIIRDTVRRTATEVTQLGSEAERDLRGPGKR